MGLLAICISFGGENVCSDAFYKWAICLFTEFKTSIYSRYKSLRGIICKCFLLLCELSFHFLNVSSEAQKFLILIKSSFTVVWSVSCVQLFCDCGLLPTRLFCSRNFPGNSTGVGCRLSSPGELPDLGTKPVSPALAGRPFTAEPPGKPKVQFTCLSFGCSFSVR